MPEKSQPSSLKDMLAKVKTTDEDRAIFAQMAEETAEALRRETAD